MFAELQTVLSIYEPVVKEALSEFLPDAFFAIILTLMTLFGILCFSALSIFGGGLFSQVCMMAFTVFCGFHLQKEVFDLTEKCEKRMKEAQEERKALEKKISPILEILNTSKTLSCGVKTVVDTVQSSAEEGVVKFVNTVGEFFDNILPNTTNACRGRF